jgi:Tfp pilus assembly protein PilF
VSLRENLESMLAAGRDDALLRYTLGNECLKAGDLAAATVHLRKAVDHDPRYTAAWRQLGHALEQSGDSQGALEAWEEGAGAAAASGDVQAGKEMAVFARRLRRKLAE